MQMILMMRGLTSSSSIGHYESMWKSNKSSLILEAYIVVYQQLRRNKEKNIILLFIFLLLK